MTAPQSQDRPDTMHEDEKLLVAQALQKQYTVRIYDTRVDIDDIQKTITFQPRTDGPQSQEDDIEQILRDFWNELSKITFTSTDWKEVERRHKENLANAKAALLQNRPTWQSKQIEDIQRVVSIQGDNGNWDYDPYMHGMYNGMEMILSMLENREPQYKAAPETWGCKKGNDLPIAALKQLRDISEAQGGAIEAVYGEQE